MDIDRQRTLSERIAANLLDTNRDGKLTAHERTAAFGRYIYTLFQRATSLSPPDRAEYQALETATTDSVMADWARYAQQNAHLFPNGIDPIDRETATKIAEASRQAVVTLRQLPEPGVIMKLDSSAHLLVSGGMEFFDVDVPSFIGDLTTPRAPKPDQGPQVPTPGAGSRTP